MTQQIINIGSAPADGTGDPAYTAFDKCNDNFTELYAAGSGGTATPPQGRLTLQTATPVMTTTQSSKIIIYYTPYVGNLVPIYNGTAMTMTTFAELATPIGDTIKSPAAIGASKVNDWFVWNDSGTVRVGHGPDWTNDTTRSAGTALTMVNGILLNNAAITNGPSASRGTYVGTTRSNASSQLDWILGGSAAGGTAGALNIWNAYNRADVSAFVHDTTDSWSYSTIDTWRAPNSSTTMRVAFVSGLTEDVFSASYMCFGNTSSLGYGSAAIGYDSTTAFSGVPGIMWSTSTAGTVVMTNGRHDATAIGAHFVSAIEICRQGTMTFYGDVGVPLIYSSGLYFNFRM